MENLIVTLVLHMKMKNDYYVGPFFSDGNGMIEVTRHRLEQEMEQSQSDFIMDYAGGLEYCQGVGLIIRDGEELNEMVERLSVYYPAKANELHELLHKSVNARYNHKTIEMGIECENEIRIDLASSVHGQSSQQPPFE